MTEDELEERLRSHFRADADRTSRLALYAAGQLAPEERSAVEAGLTADERAELALFHEMAPRPRRWWRWAAAAGAVAAAATIAVLVLPRDVVVPGGDGGRPQGLTARGVEWRVGVGVRRADTRFRLESGMALRTEDELGFFLTSAAPGYLTIFYADGAGEVVSLYPPPGGDSRVTAGEEQSLNAGARLTPGEGCEWVVSVFSEAPVDPEAARVAIARAVSEAPAADGVGSAACPLPVPKVPGASTAVLAVRR